MTGTEPRIDYVAWDWLPRAALEVQDYLGRLLTEASITAHAVDARSKSIQSFQEKCRRKGYEDPTRQVTDTVAVRLITYSETDRERAAALVRERFAVADEEDLAATKAPSRRGYSSTHLVVTGEAHGQARGWLIAGGDLARYFEHFGGLEIQIRTVAAHAWAEFEHARRYKSHAYDVIPAPDRERIDELFGKAADARQALDETFVEIERVLANPTTPEVTPVPEEPADAGEARGGVVGHPGTDGEAPARAATVDEAPPAVEAADLTAFLAERFPRDTEGSEHGVTFALDLLRLSGITSLEMLRRELSGLRSAQVRALMDTGTPVTRVRRLDDELLALYGEEYILATQDAGVYTRRGEQLHWRNDRLRNKVSVRASSERYQLFGSDCPHELRAVRVPAPRAVRELAQVIADRQGADLVSIEGAVSGGEDLPAATRPRPVRLEDGSQLWVATNLSRMAAERLLGDLLSRAPDLDLRILRDGERILPRG